MGGEESPLETGISWPQNCLFGHLKFARKNQWVLGFSASPATQRHTKTHRHNFHSGISRQDWSRIQQHRVVHRLVHMVLHTVVNTLVHMVLHWHRVLHMVVHRVLHMVVQMVLHWHRVLHMAVHRVLHMVVHMVVHMPVPQSRHGH